MIVSGLKTAVINCKNSSFYNKSFFASDLAASFQKSVADILCKKIILAIEISQKKYFTFKNVVVAGGVAANKFLRIKLESIVRKKGKKVFFPPPHLCTDNGVMIAWAGYELYKKGIVSNLGMKAKPRWPLEEIGDRN